MIVTVYYRDSLRDSYELTPSDVSPSSYKTVCLIKDAADLEDVFRRMNVVTGDPDLEIPMRLRCRSMSVGDVAFVEGDGLYLCASCGFDKVPDYEAERFVEFFAKCDPLPALDAALA